MLCHTQLLTIAQIINSDIDGLEKRVSSRRFLSPRHFSNPPVWDWRDRSGFWVIIVESGTFGGLY